MSRTELTRELPLGYKECASSCQPEFGGMRRGRTGRPKRERVNSSEKATLCSPGLFNVRFLHRGSPGLRPRLRKGKGHDKSEAKQAKEQEKSERKHEKLHDKPEQEHGKEQEAHRGDARLFERLEHERRRNA